MALGLSILALSGCSKPEAAVIGTWTSSAAGATSTTEFKQDKTFTSNTTFGGQDVAMTGKWSLQDKNLTLTVEKVRDQNVKEFVDGAMKMLSLLPAAQRSSVEASLKQLSGPMVLTLDTEANTLSGQGYAMTKVVK